MVTFNELRINDNKDGLVINCSAASGYTIEQIAVEYYKYYSPTAPVPESAGGTGSNAYIVDVAAASYFGTISLEQLKSVMQIDSMDGALFFITVYSMPSVGTDPKVIEDEAAVLDLQYLYSAGMDAIAGYVSRPSCSVPAFFEEFILLWNALFMSIDAQDWGMLQKLWTKFVAFGGNIKDPCSCS